MRLSTDVNWVVIRSLFCFNQWAKAIKPVALKKENNSLRIFPLEVFYETE